jgi:hypothetical protein
MINYYLKFTDEAQADSVLTTTELDTVTKVYANTSTLGTLYKPTGAIDAEGNPVMAALEGWHVNVLADKSPELEQYRVYPIAPSRVWG